MLQAFLFSRVAVVVRHWFEIGLNDGVMEHGARLELRLLEPEARWPPNTVSRWPEGRPSGSAAHGPTPGCWTPRRGEDRSRRPTDPSPPAGGGEPICPPASTGLRARSRPPTTTRHSPETNPA